jgi:predicted ABC-type ATPase
MSPPDKPTDADIETASQIIQFVVRAIRTGSDVPTDTILPRVAQAIADNRAAQANPCD